MAPGVYASCQAFNDIIDRDKAELVASLQQAQLQLTTLQNVKGAASQRASTKSRIKSLNLRISRIADPTRLTLFQLLTVLMDHDGTLWTAEEQALNSESTLVYEGYGEKALRHRHGLSGGPTHDDCDLPELNEEVKSWSTTDDHQTIMSFKVGSYGMKVFGRVKRSIVRAWADDALSEEMWDALDTGEVSAGKLYNSLPETIREELQREMSPSKVLDRYAAINGTTPAGYLRVPREDYDRAFRLTSVTKMSPKYILRRDYVEARLGMTNVSEASSLELSS